MTMKFELKDRDAAGRICKFTTDHGSVTTPALLPVINPNKMIIHPEGLRRWFGAEMIITNSYIIWKQPSLRETALQKGIHDLLDFSGPIMTDSGTFQSYVYGDINIDPLEIVKFQRDIGSDVGTILDVFGTPDQTKQQAKRGIEVTIQRARQSIPLKETMNLACPVQGSIYPSLRTKCAKMLGSLESDFFPIGGVVPLMENQRYSDLLRCIIASKQGLPPGKPVHLFGAGHPLIFPLAVALGCDFFDSSSYIKYAADDRLLFYWGTEKLADLSELPCYCPVCSQYSLSELRRLDEVTRRRELAKHNLYVCFNELKLIRNAIAAGSLWELVERRATCNPFLLEALHVLRGRKIKDFLEQSEPISKGKALFYTGSHTIHRPLIQRIHSRIIDRLPLTSRMLIILQEGGKPYSREYFKEIQAIRKKHPKAQIVIDSALGPVPLELDEMYPFAQSVISRMTDKETTQYQKKIFKRYTEKHEILRWKKEKTDQETPSTNHTDHHFDILRVKYVADMQFGRGMGSILLDGLVKLGKSKRTGKIRTIYCNGKHILSMRANDGLFTLKKEGGKLLHAACDPPRLRVIVNNDAVPFIKEGKSVFAKFVVDCDPELRPFDECLIVDVEDRLLAVGRCLLNRSEMLSFVNGMAVKSREHW
jgi:7-cyano-7-deazaguanine tRNA-ribosyltransferase